MADLISHIFNMLFHTSGEMDLQTFPNDFIFGAATSAYQVEGAWNVSGKGESIWDNFTHIHPERIEDRSNGDIACDSYNNLKYDLEMVQWVGVTHYRFSLSWTRLLPNGYADKINNDGLRYYNELIDGLISRNIIPMITLYHWDLPQILSDKGGWLNESTADVFVEYARVVFNLFGDRVKLWTTINEPYQICQRGYGEGTVAPGIESDGNGSYTCGRNIILAHAKTYRMYAEEFKGKQNGKIGFTADAFWFEPASNSSEDIEAAERAMQFHFGWFMNPIYSTTGDYPQVMKERIAENSNKENLTKSRLTPFTEDEINLIKETYDFLGLNYYTAQMASANTSNMNWKTPSYSKDLGINTYVNSEWKNIGHQWIYDLPWGLRKVLNWIKKTYNNPAVIITENGVSDTSQRRDSDRIHYIMGHMQAVMEALYTDQCNVKGYIYWSIMDNMEWYFGYKNRFGLYYVDFKSLNKTRTRKDSAYYYKCVIKTKTLNCTDNLQIV